MYKHSKIYTLVQYRGGCDCFCGECPKPCLCCFSCNEKCSDESRLYAGDIEGKPGENFMEGERANSFLLGRTVQPKGGGGFTPTLQIMDRGDGLVDTAAKGWPYEGKEFAVAKGP